MSQPRVKKSISPAELWFCGAMLGLVGLCFTVFGYLEEAPKFERLRRDGVTANAEVLRKINFTQSCEPTRKSITRTCRNREFHLRYLIANTTNLTWQYGSVDVGQDVFDATREGQKIAVMYLQEDSTDLRLASDVQNFTMLWYNLLGVFGAFATIFCTIQAVLALRRAQKGKIYA